jgi:hypothetical protein
MSRPLGIAAFAIVVACGGKSERRAETDENSTPHGGNEATPETGGTASPAAGGVAGAGRLPGAPVGGARECEIGHPFCCDRTTGAFVDGDCDRKTGILTCGADEVPALIGGVCALNGIDVDACDELEDRLCDGMGLKCTEAVRCGTTCTCDPPSPSSNQHPGDERLRWHCLTLAC